MIKNFTLIINLVLFFNFVLTAGTNQKTVNTVATTEVITIDGVDSEASWSKTGVANNFIQRDPKEGEDASEVTEIRILYDNDAVYFFCKMFDSKSAEIVKRLSRRDDDADSDDIAIGIDTYHDHLTSTTFRVNAAGTKSDGLTAEDGRSRDFSWDAVWEVATKINHDGWTAEFRIPFSILKFNAENNEMTWGANFVRKLRGNKEFSMWSFVRKNESGWVSKYGHITGFKNVASPKKLEVMPYLVNAGKYFPEQDGKAKVSKMFPNLGLDAKYGVSGNSTLNLTINPDFGQVEVDPSELNLTTFETFYQEKRPFFIEGANLFNFSTFGQGFGPGLFYSRRIGKSIGVELPEGGKIIEEPQTATILGAAKFTGQTDGLQYGFLGATTEKEFYTYLDSDNVKQTDVAMPAMNYGVIRLKQNIWDGSTIGMIATSRTSKDLQPVTVGGFDWWLRFFDNQYTVSGFIASASSDSLHPKNIKETFKDAGSGRFSFAKVGGDHWLFDMSAYYTGEKYNINDVGYFRRPNDYGTWNSLTYKDDQPGEYFRSFRLTVPLHVMYNFENVLLEKQTGFRWNTETKNYYNFDGQVNYNFSTYDDRESRGYGLYKRPAGVNVDLNFNSDESKNFIYGIGGGFGSNEIGADGFAIGAGVAYRPTTSTSIDIRFMNAGRFGEQAWVTVENDTSIFGDRTVRQKDLTIRGSVLFNPDLSIQLYTQYFAVKGRYENYGKLVDTKIVNTSYNAVNSFNETSLNLNLVLRWEYLPGSVLYAVWAHNRSWGNGIYNTTYLDELNNTFKVAPNNVFTLKVSYWLNV